jgi:hypothetical protein
MVSLAMLAEAQRAHGVWERQKVHAAHIMHDALHSVVAVGMWRILRHETATVQDVAAALQQIATLAAML